LKDESYTTENTILGGMKEAFFDQIPGDKIDKENGQCPQITYRKM
jgi:hypothetical protein